MPRVELVYAGDCPNVAEARARLLHAFAKTKTDPHWREWQSDVPGSPEHVGRYGSPTILVDGRDVAAVEGNGGPCCRLYEQPDGSMRGVPSVDLIVAALERRVGEEDSNTQKHKEGMMSGKRKIGVFSAGCPACQETIDLVSQAACPSCEVSILDMNDSAVTRRAQGLGIRSVPAVVIDGKLADCCSGRGPDEATLRAEGLGRPVA